VPYPLALVRTLLAPGAQKSAPTGSPLSRLEGTGGSSRLGANFQAGPLLSLCRPRLPRPTTASSPASERWRLSGRLSAGDGFLVAARALGLRLPCQTAGLVPARRQLAHLHRALLRVDAAATTYIPGYDIRKRIARAAGVHGHGSGLCLLPLRHDLVAQGRVRRMAADLALAASSARFPASWAQTGIQSSR
jgi:hypothetical protein